MAILTVYRTYLFFFVLTLFHGRSLCCLPNELEALLQFRSLLPENGTSEEYKVHSWVSTKNCCRWEGVECSRTTPPSVIIVDFRNLLLPTKEIIPSSVMIPLFRLRGLTQLILHNNQFQGPIPGSGLLNLTRLVSLDLAANRLNGSVPTQLFHLISLQKLFLQDNMLSGSLENGSVGIGNLTHLDTLNLSNNSFSGPIPGSLFNLENLLKLMLDHNQFSMEIPSDIGRLYNLSELYLHHNYLSGEIPNSMQNMSKLFRLELNNNQLSGEIPWWVFDMESLDQLDLGENALSLRNLNHTPKGQFEQIRLSSCNLYGSSIPSWLANQTSLAHLDLRNCSLTGSIPPWLTSNKGLVFLVLSDNSLSGLLPKDMFKNSSIDVLSLGRNHFSGKLPDNIGDAVNLTFLLLAENQLSGSLPKSMSELTNLMWLDLSTNDFSGDEFPSMKSSSLSHVSIFSNRLSGDVPTSFPNSINVLQLSDNNFSALPGSVAELFNLTVLDLANNSINGVIPPEIANLTILKVLSLRNNQFHGFIPNELSNLKSLQILDASGNQLVGEIPSSLGNLVGMRSNLFKSSGIITFDIYAGLNAPVIAEINLNVLHGIRVSWKKSEQELSGWNLLWYILLDLSNNQLSGSIPDSIGALSDLKSLDLSSNNLSSIIPKSLGEMRHIESLNLSHNSLSGQIPQSFANLLQLQNLDFSNNYLSGPIPGGSQFRVLDLRAAFANNSGLCGSLIDIPCPVVSPGNPEAEKSKDSSLPWKGAAAGFASGLLLSILALYALYFFKFPMFNDDMDKARLLNVN